MTARTINVCDSRDVTLHLHSRVSTDTVEDADADVEDSDDVVEDADVDVKDADVVEVADTNAEDADIVEDSDADVEDADDVVEGGDADVEDADFQKRRSVMAFNPVPVRRF